MFPQLKPQIHVLVSRHICGTQVGVRVGGSTQTDAQQPDSADRWEMVRGGRSTRTNARSLAGCRRSFMSDERKAASPASGERSQARPVVRVQHRPGRGRAGAAEQRCASHRQGMRKGPSREFSSTTAGPTALGGFAV